MLPRLLFPSLVFCLLTQGTHAQAPPPAEPVPQAPAVPVVWSYNGQLTGAYSAGAVRRALLNASGAASVAKGRHWGLPLTAFFIFGKQENRLREREVLVNATPYYRKGHFRAYALGTYERSNLRGILNRSQVGAGPGWAVFRHDTLNRELVVSNLLLREGTQFVDGTSRVVYRSSLRVKAAYEVGVLTFVSHTLYQPSLRDAAHDYRFSNAATLAVRVTKRFSCTASYTYSFEQRVLEARNRGNTNLTVGVAIRR